MATLLCFGYGYSARHYVAHAAMTEPSLWDRVIGTSRNPPPSGASGTATVLRFDGDDGDPRLAQAIATADALLVSIPPERQTVSTDADPTLRAFGAAIAAAPALRAVVYLSTVGVYGDHDGAPVDETTAPKPVSARSQSRLLAEAEWSALGRQRGLPVAILRLAGIYGPGQNALENLRDGSARRVDKPGQVFNRIHVEDIAQAIAAAFARHADGVFNVCDDLPAPPQDVVAYAAEQLGMTPPPLIPFAEAVRTMSPMAKSFYGENKRVKNQRLKEVLGVALRYPTYREGIAALAQAMH